MKTNIDRRADLHSDKLLFAYNRAREELNRNELARKHRHGDRKKNKIYIQNRGFKDKIQGKWKSEVYVIVDKPYKSVYSEKASE